MPIEPQHAVTVSIRAPMPPKVFKPLPKPALSFAETARRESRAVKESWDQTATQAALSPKAIMFRRAEWLGQLPEGAFDRPAGRAAWGVNKNAADARLDALERAGLLRRVATKPIRWERVE